MGSCTSSTPFCCQADRRFQIGRPSGLRAASIKFRCGGAPYARGASAAVLRSIGLTLALRRVSVTGFRSEFFGANSLLSLRFFAVLLWTAAVLALIADRWTPGQGMAMLAAAIVAVIAINGIFSFWQEYRAEETMAALQRLLPHQVRALRNGKTVLLR